VGSAEVDSQHEILTRLLDVLAPGERDLVAMIEAYFDESGSDDGSPALCVAGYLFRKEECQALDLKWKVVLDDFGLPYFRMSACAHGNHPFDKLCLNQRIEVEKLMIELVRSHMLFGAAVSVNEQEYNSWPARRLIGSAYTYCCWQSLAGMLDWLEQNKIDGDLAYFFESGHEHQSQANAIMKRIFDNPKLRQHYRYITHAFVDKQKVRPVQTADILAWLHAKHLKDLQNGKSNPRADFVALVEGRPHRAFIANRETVGSVIAYGDLLEGREPDIPGISGSYGPWRFWSPFWWKNLLR
jgi:hypothetical protein